MEMNFENRVQKYHALLTENDEKIASYLLANKKESILSFTITDLSEAISVSPASITRFCKKIKFNSFQEMKYSLLKEETSKRVQNEKVSDIIFSYYEMIMTSTLQFITEEQILAISDAIIHADHIIFCGIGNSGLIAQEFNSRIERMGISSQAITDSHGMIIKSALLGKNDVIICISYTGKTHSVIDAARLAKKNKATVIAITNYENTELTKLSDEVVLISSHRYIDDKKFINTQISSLFFLDILTYHLLDNDTLGKNRQKTLEAIHKYG